MVHQKKGLEGSSMFIISKTDISPNFFLPIYAVSKKNSKDRCMEERQAVCPGEEKRSDRAWRTRRVKSGGIIIYSISVVCASDSYKGKIELVV